MSRTAAGYVFKCKVDFDFFHGMVGMFTCMVEAKE